MLVQSTEQFIARPPTEADIPALIDLFTRYSQAQFGTTEVTETSLHNEWQTPGFNPQTDIHTLWTAEGRAVGFVEAWTLGTPPVRNALWLRVDPDYQGQGLAEQLLAWGEARVRQVIPHVDEQIQIEASMFTRAHDSYLPNVLEANGYHMARLFWRMEIELNQPIPEPVVAQGIVIRAYDPEHEFVKLVQAKDEAFHDHYGHVEEPLESLLKRSEHWRTMDIYDPTLWFVAIDRGEIAAIATCYTYIDENPDVGWIGALGVRPAWRKQGLGLALLQHAFREFQKRGQPRAGLGVDSSNLAGATRLYARAGMHVASKDQLYLKVIRAGKTLSNH